jgi:hypothetical protein
MLDGYSPYTCNWTGPDGFSSTEEDITGLSKGRYVLMVSDSNGCSAAADSTLIQVDAISMTVEISEIGDFNVLCNGSSDGTIKIKSVTGYGDINDFYFHTTGPDGFSSPFRIMTGLRAGQYHLSVTDSLGCIGESDVTLTEPPRLITGQITGDTAYVEDTNYVYSLQDTSAGNTYNWWIQGGEIWSGQGTASIEVEWRSTQEGRLTVLETDENGCKGDTVSFDTEYYTLPDTTTGLSGLNGKSFRFFPNPADNILNIRGLEQVNGTIELYSLTGALVLKEQMQNRVNIAHLDAGVYYMLARNQNGQVLVTHRIIKH